MRVFFSSLLCFFLAMRLRRFLMTEPIRPPFSALRMTGTPTRSPGPGGWIHTHRRDYRRCGVPVIRKAEKGGPMGSVIKKRRKRMAKKKHRKLLKKTRVQRRNKK